jgi:hypothetical protein
MGKRPLWWGLLHPNVTIGLIVIIVFLLLIALGNVFQLYASIASHNIEGSLETALAVFIYAVPAIGLLQLKRWAWKLEIGLAISFSALGLYLLVSGNIVEGTFIVITHGPVGLYLLSDNCRRLFYPDV